MKRIFECDAKASGDKIWEIAAQKPVLFNGRILSQEVYYKKLGEKTFAQLSDEQLRCKPNEESNIL